MTTAAAVRTPSAPIQNTVASVRAETVTPVMESPAKVRFD